LSPANTSYKVLDEGVATPIRPALLSPPFLYNVLPTSHPTALELIPHYKACREPATPPNACAPHRSRDRPASGAQHLWTRGPRSTLLDSPCGSATLRETLL